MSGGRREVAGSQPMSQNKLGDMIPYLTYVFGLHFGLSWQHAVPVHGDRVSVVRVAKHGVVTH
jgi:hypothetical protein